jgi:hypothetical protein
MSSHLAHLAPRLASAPAFLAYALAEYGRSERLDAAGIAALLGCSTETLTHLVLCRSPRAPAPLFRRQVALIVQRFSVNPEALAEVVRRGQGLFHLRAAADGQKTSCASSRCAPSA